ncbi:MAG: hypothetical protein RLZ00_64 [Pseudomonadota bacterium]
MAETRKLLANFVHQAFEVVDVFKAAVHTGKADVGDLVEFFKFTHDELANAGGGHFPLTETEEFFFDALNGVVDLFSADGAFAQGETHGFEKFFAFVFDAAAVFFDDVGETDVGAFVGGVTFFAGTALTAATHGVAVFGHACFNDLGF